MKPSRSTTYPFRVQPHAVAVAGLPDAKVAAYFRDLLRDLESGKPSTPQAREMIEHVQHISKISRIKGLASARVRSSLSADPNNVSTRPAPPPRTAPSSPEPDRAAFLAHAATIGLPEKEAEACWRYWSGAGWKENDGRPVLNWKKKLMNWKMDHSQKRGLAASASTRRPSTANLAGESTYDDDDPLFGKNHDPKPAKAE